MLRAVAGTAGHIDHGKTRLVEALTGIDCDRLAEEKDRGITIDLGFAHLDDGDLELGFVDVPGHERFLTNALAGLGGIRVLLLVVAADEGVKPQTREHLAICSLLPIPAAIVALTKSDLVDTELLELAALEVEELLAPTPFAGAEIIPVSSVTGAGITELRAGLVALARRHALTGERAEPARLPIDRAFYLKGLGLAVTGTLAAGKVATGDELELLPEGVRTRVRSIQVHGKDRDAAQAGERTSLRLSGLELGEVARGMELASPGALRASHSLLLELTLLPDAPHPLQGWTPVRAHLFAAEALGRIRPLSAARLEPGGSGIVELRLEGPLVAVRGDHLIIRRPSPPATLGGGEVLDPQWGRFRGRALAAALAALSAGRDEAIAAWVLFAQEAGASAEELARRLGEPAPAVRATLTALAERGALLAAAPGPSQPLRYVAPSVFKRLGVRVESQLKAHFQRERLSPGLPKAEAIERLFPPRARALAPVYLDWLVAQKKIALDAGRVTLPGRSAELTGEESSLSRRAAEHYEAAGLAPPSPGEVAELLGAKAQILDGVLRHLVDRGRLVKLPEGLLIASSSLEALRRNLIATGWERFSVGQFKDRFGLSRKWAIPLLEYLDSVGATKRAGQERLVVR